MPQAKKLVDKQKKKLRYQEEQLVIYFFYTLNRFLIDNRWIEEAEVPEVHTNESTV